MATNSTRLPAKPFQPGNTAAKGHGAPRGNTNSMRHGLKGRRKLSIGNLPKGCSWINTLVSGLRRELEGLVFQYHGELSYQHQLVIQSAARHEQSALLCQRWLRIAAETMSHTERLTYLTTIAAESDKRDKSIERLCLDRAPATILESLYAPIQTELPESEGDD